MANPEHLKILKQGVEVWNKWRKDNPRLKPDLDRSNLESINLANIDFNDVKLTQANLSGANLVSARFTGAVLSKTILSFANLAKADFSKADISEARIFSSNLYGVNFQQANLTNAFLAASNLLFSDLTKAKLFDANLTRTTFNSVEFKESNFNGAKFRFTAFINCDLRQVEGLDSVNHSGPSSIDINTFYRSEGDISEAFLKGIGVPDTFFAYIRSLTSQNLNFYSCFISYSSKDQFFADKLYVDLQNRGVRCWLASEDMKIGAKIRVDIDESISMHDKLLLVLSKHSVASDWVEQEVETALERERKEKRTVLFPIRLDDTVMKINVGWPAIIKNSRNIGDFRKWRNPEAYQKAFDRLLRDLKADEKAKG